MVFLLEAGIVSGGKNFGTAHGQASLSRVRRPFYGKEEFSLWFKQIF
jgi:hypothetical protein